MSRPARHALDEDARGPGTPGLVVAIDAGSSKTDGILVADDGTVVGEVRGPGLLHDQGIEAWGATFAGIIAELGVADAEVLVACVAHVDLPEQEAQLAAALQAQGWARRVVVRNDTFAVLRAGVSGRTIVEPTVAVVCGSGFNCVGVGVDGATARFLALGLDSGDWGGGFDLGRAGLWSASRAEDGRGPGTVLRAWYPERFERASMREVGLALHAGELDDDDIRSCARDVVQAAEEGDPVAVDIIGRQAAEIVLTVGAALTSLGVRDEASTLVLGGSIVVHSAELVGQVTSRLRDTWPRTSVTVSMRPPVLGAALIGLDEISDGPSAVAGRLEAQFLPSG